MNILTKICCLCRIHQSAITTHKVNHVYSLFKKMQIKIVVIDSPGWFVDTNNLARVGVAYSENLCKWVQYWNRRVKF